jgi:hypothetical protein
MTAQFLQNELTNLIQEAKRKNSDLRHVRNPCVVDGANVRRLLVLMWGGDVSGCREVAARSEIHRTGGGYHGWYSVCRPVQKFVLKCRWDRVVESPGLPLAVPYCLRNPEPKVQYHWCGLSTAVDSVKGTGEGKGLAGAGSCTNVFANMAVVEVTRGA